jgi:DNA replication protein DnaC
MHKKIYSKINSYLDSLHLPTIKKIYKEIAEQSIQEQRNHEEYLLILLEHEKENRYNNRIQRQLRQSKLDLDKKIDNFNFKRLPPKALMLVKAIREGDFIKNKENILTFGNPGSGKTHLLSAIAQEQIMINGKKIICISCCILVQDLLRAKQELQLQNVLKKYSKFDAILIDDIGYVEQSKEEMEVLFTLLADRYERASIMLTSNLPFSKWEKIFKDPITATAAIDRLIHHSIIVELNLPSYRIEEAKSRKKNDNKK